MESGGRVKEIIVYPIKACRGISVPCASVTSTGFRWDRQWLIVDSRNRAYTQNKEPKLALVEVILPKEAFVENWQPTAVSFLTVKASGMAPLKVPLLRKAQRKVDNVSVWEWSGSAFDEGDEAAAWFSRYLDKSARLVRFDTESEVRPTDAEYAQGFKTMFSNGFPFLILSQSSLKALNMKLKEPLPVNRFRPNIVVEGCEPFAEDLWRTLKINGLTFRGVKLCSRCQVTTINQETGIKGSEPSEALNRFRSGDILFSGAKAKKKVFFGQNLVCEESLNPKHGVDRSVRVGDPIYIVKKIRSTTEAAA